MDSASAGALGGAGPDRAHYGIIALSITKKMKPMAKLPALPTATDEDARALLARYNCPVPFHEVRTRFLGNVATPATASPIKMVEDLWGGELPAFDSIDA